MCLFRWRGFTFAPEGSVTFGDDTTVMRASARWPCTVDPPTIPGPSKRTSFRDSVLLT